MALIKPKTLPAEWQESTAPELWEWKRPGDILTGKLLSAAPINLKGKTVLQYVVALDAKHVVKLLATYDLRQKLLRKHVGQIVHIEYLGEDENVRGGESQTPMRAFSVYSKPDPNAARDESGAPYSDEDIPF